MPCGDHATHNLIMLSAMVQVHPFEAQREGVVLHGCVGCWGVALDFSSSLNKT